MRLYKEKGEMSRALLAALIMALLSFAAGWFGGRAVLSTAFDLEKSNAVIAAEKAMREQLEEQKRLGDMLSDQLASAESDVLKLKEEKQHALYKTTAHRACFTADTVRVLNSNSKAGVAAVPAATGSFDAGGGGLAAAGAIESALTDTDVAYWIANAQSQYGICQSRLKALIAFERMR